VYSQPTPKLTRASLAGGPSLQVVGGPRKVLFGDVLQELRPPGSPAAFHRRPAFASTAGEEHANIEV